MNKYPPECPFCGRAVNRPEEIKAEFSIVTGGHCQCGAVYVCDPTGHNTGEAYSDALALAKVDSQIAGIKAEPDYEMADIDYDEKTHQRMFSKGHSSLSGRLVFVKVKESSGKAAVTEDKAATPSQEHRPATKQFIRKLLESKEYDEIAERTRYDKGIIRWLISLAYDKQEDITWRAIEAMGIISRRFAKEGIDMRDTVRRLLWSMGEESGGIGWSAAEMLGEIVCGEPALFNDIVPIIWSFRGEDMFRAGIVWAMGRIASMRPELVQFISGDLAPMLEDNNPTVRAYAAWTAGLLPDAIIMEKCRELIKGLLKDSSEIRFYKNGFLESITVGELAREVLHKAAK